MKTIFISDLAHKATGTSISLFCWLRSRREQSKRIFLQLVDSTGEVQAVVEKGSIDVETAKIAKKVAPESALEVLGKLARVSANRVEILADKISVVGSVSLDKKLRPRHELPGWPTPNAKQTDQQLTLRHLYLRNPTNMAILRFRSALEASLRRWFESRRILSFAAPILTPCPLYEDGTAVRLRLHEQDVFLTQCVGFYLEAAAHAFEGVYNIGPSFRAAESKSPKHLVEYWHVKAELAWGDLNDIMALCEEMLEVVVMELQQVLNETAARAKTKPCLDALKTPYVRITYQEALERLERTGDKMQFGDAISGEHQTLLATQFDRPFWIVGNPRGVEPFPYVIDSEDTRLTRTADLIATGDGGELLGTAEKIHQIEQLDERMREKSRHTDNRYQFVREVHELGCVPHIAFGMGFERLIRWLLGLHHVRDAIPFPRVINRKFFP